MNFIGKIFVVLILIMSIIFMTAAAVVYATHRNWEDLAKQRAQELADTESELGRLRTAFDRLTGQLASQKDVARQQIAKLQTEQGLLVARNQGIQQELDALKETNREAAAAVASTQENNTRLADENSNLRIEVRANQKASDDSLSRALAATEQVNNVVGQLQDANQRTGVLMADVARMRAVLDSNGINPSTSSDDVTPDVDGMVQAVRRNGSQLTIQISIGADDGLRVGHKVEVFRGRKYLGRAEILQTAPDRAIGRLDPRFHEGRVQEGDRVATRLKLS